MIEQLLHLPYAHLWLPASAACGIATVVYWALTRSARSSVTAAGAAALTVETAPAVDPDPFAQGSVGEQRTAFRRGGNPIEVIYTAPEFRTAPRRGYVLDRSVGGLRLMLAHELLPGTVVSLRPANASAIVPEVEVEVRSCRPSGTQPGEYDLGCQFVKSPPYSIMLLFG